MKLINKNIEDIKRDIQYLEDNVVEYEQIIENLNEFLGILIKVKKVLKNYLDTHNSNEKIFSVGDYFNNRINIYDEICFTLYNILTNHDFKLFASYQDIIDLYSNKEKSEKNE